MKGWKLWFLFLWWQLNQLLEVRQFKDTAALTQCRGTRHFDVTVSQAPRGGDSLLGLLPCHPCLPPPHALAPHCPFESIPVLASHTLLFLLLFSCLFTFFSFNTRCLASICFSRTGVLENREYVLTGDTASQRASSLEQTLVHSWTCSGCRFFRKSLPRGMVGKGMHAHVGVRQSNL